MKFLVFALFVTSLYSTEIKDARFNLKTGMIEVDVIYGGGCEDHLWDLEVGSCMERMPVICHVKLVHVSYDTCEALIFETLEFDPADYKLNEEYYSGADLLIFSSAQRKNKKFSITLPRL